MTYERFEDLPVWQEAIKLAHGIYDLTEDPGFRISASLRDQIERSSMSVSDNIAEGFERGTTNELLAFLYIARGSAGETRSKLCFMEDRGSLTKFRPELRRVKALAESLQNSPIKGTRHLNETVKQEFQRKKKAEQAQKVLLRALPAWHPLRKDAEAKGII